MMHMDEKCSSAYILVYLALRDVKTRTFNSLREEKEHVRDSVIARLVLRILKLNICLISIWDSLADQISAMF